MEVEQSVKVRVSRRMINLLTSLMPTLEGLLLITVLDGKEGLILVRYHQSAAKDIGSFLKSMKTRYPKEFAPQFPKEEQQKG